MQFDKMGLGAVLEELKGIASSISTRYIWCFSFMLSSAGASHLRLKPLHQVHYLLIPTLPMCISASTGQPPRFHFSSYLSELIRFIFLMVSKYCQGDSLRNIFSIKSNNFEPLAHAIVRPPRFLQGWI